MNQVKIKKSDAKKITKLLSESANNYRKMMAYMCGDLPIQSLVLPKALETTLLNAGCLRVYDLFDRDLTKIKGIGVVRARYLTSCLDQFLAMR